MIYYSKYQKILLKYKFKLMKKIRIITNSNSKVLQNSEDTKFTTNSNSPLIIKNSLLKDIPFSPDCIQLFKFGPSLIKKVRIPQKNYFEYISKNLKKYNSHQQDYYVKLINKILFNCPFHVVAKFKDYLVWNETYDYLNNFYDLQKSRNMLPKIGFYYETYTLFNPNYFSLLGINKIILKYIRYREKYVQGSEIKEMDKNININNTNNEAEENNNLNDGNGVKIKINEKIINISEMNTENSKSLLESLNKYSTIKPNENNNLDSIDKIKNNRVRKDSKNSNNFENNEYSSDISSILELINNNKNKKKNSPKSKRKNDQILSTKTIKKKKIYLQDTKIKNKYNKNNFSKMLLSFQYLSPNSRHKFQEIRNTYTISKNKNPTNIYFSNTKSKEMTKSAQTQKIYNLKGQYSNIKNKSTSKKNIFKNKNLPKNNERNKKNKIQRIIFTKNKSLGTQTYVKKQSNIKGNASPRLTKNPTIISNKNQSRKKVIIVHKKSTSINQRKSLSNDFNHQNSLNIINSFSCSELQNNLVPKLNMKKTFFKKIKENKSQNKAKLKYCLLKNNFSLTNQFENILQKNNKYRQLFLNYYNRKSGNSENKIKGEKKINSITKNKI